jgi:uncharacterized FlaG/YvyC family protein
MLVGNAPLLAIGSEREGVVVLTPSLPVSPVSDRRQEQRPADERAPRHKAETAERPASIRRASAGSERARLAYDTELSRVFVEILDPRTGDVLNRFPPENLVEHLESFVDESDPRGGHVRAGRIVDELA